MKPCEKYLLCGHRCAQICGNDCNKKLCTSIVTVRSKCGHKVEIECGKQFNVETQLNNCRDKCDTKLKCSHTCSGSCGECYQKRLHIFCIEKCERLLTCGHVCKALCGQNCKCNNKKCLFNRKSLNELIVKINELIEEQRTKLMNNYSESSLSIIKKLNKLELEANRRDITKSELSLIIIKLEMIEQITLFKQNFFNFKSIQDYRQNFTPINQFINSLSKRIDIFLNFIDMHYSNHLQQISDANNEMNRFFAISETLELIIGNNFDEEGIQLLIEALELLSTLEPFTYYVELKLRLLVSYAEKYKLIKQLEYISDVSPKALIIKEYFNNSKAHGNINISVKSIQRYNNNQFRDKFRNSFTKDRRMLLWHGTRQRNLTSIFEEGLKLPSGGRGMFGNGVYFADRVTKSAQYTDYKNGIGTLLLCEVAVGNMLGMTTANNALSLLYGYQSVKGIGRQTADPNDEKIIEHQLVVPLGKTIASNVTATSLEYNEYIIYDPKRALIRFVVEIE